MDLYQLKKPEIFSILVWNQDMAHHCNSPDIWVYEDWICRAWKRIKYMCCILYSGPAQAYIYLSTAYWVVALLRGKHKSPFTGFCDSLIEVGELRKTVLRRPVLWHFPFYLYSYLSQILTLSKYLKLWSVMVSRTEIQSIVAHRAMITKLVISNGNP